MSEMIHGKGRVRCFDDSKGVGYIILEDRTTEVFVHQTKIKMEGHRILYEDQPVVLDYYKEEKEYKADSVTPDLKWVVNNAPAGRGVDRSYGGGYGGSGGRGRYGSGYNANKGEYGGGYGSRR